MTREEEILKEAKAFADGQCEALIKPDDEYAFEQGARWADEHPHWISVEDELPPKDDEFITDLSINVLVTDGETIYRCFYDYDIMCWLDGNFCQFDNITHWMPLPSIEEIRGNQGETSPNEEGGEE